MLQARKEEVKVVSQCRRGRKGGIEKEVVVMQWRQGRGERVQVGKCVQRCRQKGQQVGQKA